MADTKISAATSKATPAGTEEVPLNDGGVSKRMTLSNLVSLVTRSSLGLATSDTPQFTGIEVGNASDTTLTRASAGDIAVEGNRVMRVGGTDLPVADGGTGASTAAAAATNLGLGTGDSPQFTAVNIGHATDTTVTRTGAGDIAVEGNGLYRAGGTDVAVADGGTGQSTRDTARANLAVSTLDLPAGALAATMPRILVSSATGALTSGTVYLTSLDLPTGLVITSITFWSDTAAINGPTHQVFGIYDSSLARLAVTTDDTSTAWSATASKTLNLTPGTFTTTYAGLHYLAILMTATTAAGSVMTGAGARGGATGPYNSTPYPSIVANTSQTSLPDPAVRSATGTQKFYAYIS